LTGIQSLEARAALGSIFAAASYILGSGRWIHRSPQKSFDRAVNLAFIASRLGLYILVYFILHLGVRGDIPGFYVEPARAALQGALPYIGYSTSYAPLHAPLDACLLLLWNSPLVIILFSIIAECFVLPVWLRVSRLFLSEETVRIAAVLYLASALSVQFVTIDGQDNAVLEVLLGFSLLLLARYRALLSGAVLAAGAVVIKFLPLLFAPAFFIVAARRFRWQALVDGEPVITAAVNWLMGEDNLEPAWNFGGRGERFEVEITGDPTVSLTFKGLQPETIAEGLKRNPGVVATANHCVNAIPDVCAAEPGIKTYLDLPLFAGRPAATLAGR